MPQSESKTFNLILTQIVGPVLILAMVGSLVLFLIEVLYRGPHTPRLYWIMFLFTAASVLVSRISIEEGRERAQQFGLALAVATFVTCYRLVEFSYDSVVLLAPVCIVVLVAVVMWCTAKLTWDCTVVDGSRDTSAMGLVERVRQSIQTEKTGDESNFPPAKDGLFVRLWKAFTGTSRNNTPGLWVFYFAIVAFPIFGFGQWFVQADAKQWIFVLFSIYLGSGLCLLAMTSLLGLNRYLAKRKVEVPPAIVRDWMLVAGVFATIVILLVMLLPKPASQSSFQDMFAWFQSTVRETSRLAPGNDGEAQEQEARKQQKRADAKDGEADGGEKRGADDKEQQAQKGGDQNQKRHQDDSKPVGQKVDKPDQGSDSQEQNSRRESEGVENAKRSERNLQKHEPPDAEGNKKQTNDDKNANKQQQHQKRAQRRNDENQQRGKNPNTRRSSPLTRALEAISKGMKWIVYAIGLVALLFVFWILRGDLAKLLQLFKKKKESEDDQPMPIVKPPPAPASFATFRNPFRSNKHKSMFGWQLAQYTLAALEAWGREFGIERDPEITPQEFAWKLKAANKNVSQAAREFAEVYGRVAFSQEKVGREEFQPLVKLWDQMSIAMQAKRNQQATVAG